MGERGEGNEGGGGWGGGGWSGEIQYTIQFDLQLLSLGGSTYYCQHRPVPDTLCFLLGDVKQQKETKEHILCPGDLYKVITYTDKREQTNKTKKKKKKERKKERKEKKKGKEKSNEAELQTDRLSDRSADRDSETGEQRDRNSYNNTAASMSKKSNAHGAHMLLFSR